MGNGDKNRDLQGKKFKKKKKENEMQRRNLGLGNSPKTLHPSEPISIMNRHGRESGAEFLHSRVVEGQESQKEFVLRAVEERGNEEMKKGRETERRNGRERVPGSFERERETLCFLRERNRPSERDHVFWFK